VFPQRTSHRRTSSSVELISLGRLGVQPHKDTLNVLTDAWYVMKSLVGTRATSVKTDVGYDLEINGIEVGSYGRREVGDFTWVYGTGLALPRFSQALNRGK
jgi:hypothetical protein